MTSGLPSGGPTDAREAFRQAEEQAFADRGLAIRPHTLQLREPTLGVRVLEAGSGPPAVLIHGGGGFASNWLPLMAGLSRTRCLAVDRPGCGLSDPFDYTGVGIRRHAVSFIGSLLDALELERAPLIANSMGGLWSLLFALEHPERVSALVLLGCPALFPGTGAPLPLRLFSIGPLRRGLMSLARRRPASIDPRSGLRHMLGRAALDAMTDAELECARLAPRIPGAMRSFETLLGSLFRVGFVRPGIAVSVSDLRQIEAPTLLVWGRRDPFGTVATAERGVASMRNAQLEVVEGGHQPWSSQPGRCAELVVAFLDEAVASAEPPH